MGACETAASNVAALADKVMGGGWNTLPPRMAKFDAVTDRDPEALVTYLAEAMNCVAVPGQGSGGHGSGIQVTANGQLDNMDIAGGMFEDHWTGSAADNFRENYQLKLDTVADHQFTMFDVLVCAIQAQKELYDSSVKTILDIHAATQSALEAIDAKDNAVATVALTALAAALTVTVTVMTAGTGAPAAIAISIAVVGGVASTGASAASMNFNTEDPNVVMNSYLNAVEDVENHFREREQEIAAGLSGFAQVLNDDLGKTSFGKFEFPEFRFKPTGFALGSGGLGEWEE